MLRVGLTGGIGSGKSTAARSLIAAGATLVDADVLARRVLDPGTEGLAEVVAAFGDGVLDARGALDRSALARLVFQDEAARRRLNEIVHPRVRRLTDAAFAAAAPGAVVVNDVPLLVEAGLAPSYHLVVVVEAPVEERLRRLVTSRGMAEADARARMAAQADDVARRAVADVVLHNGGVEHDLAVAVEALWEERLHPFAENLAARLPAPRRDCVALAAPDPGWPAAGTRLAARVSRAVGGARVDHIGSTAVAGLTATDVIDLQVSAPSLSVADEWAGRLAEAGFAATGPRHDTPHRSVSDLLHERRCKAEDGWAKRLHLSCDPGREAHLHVRVEGSAGWTTSLLLRDWLRATPAACAEYAAVKRDLAERFPRRDDYASAKAPWFVEACDSATDWARRTGWTPGP